MKKEEKIKGGILLFIFGIILLNINLVSAPDPVTGSSSFSGGSASSFGSGAGDSSGSVAFGSSRSYSGGGSFYEGPFNSFSGTPYNYISGGYAIYGASSNPQFNNPGFFSGTNFISPEVYWPKFNSRDCMDRADMIIQIAPGGCNPAVVRSDLLEEQPVPVFCKVMSIQVNPLIDVTRIRSMTFSGRGGYPKGISGISYYPAHAAIRSQQNLISSPINDNLGYVVIILNRVEKESDMPESIQGNITALMNYDIQGAFGIGNTNFYISEMSDGDWSNNYRQYGFWNGKGYIRADSIEPNQVSISIYRDSDTRQSSFTLQKGQTSSDIYLSGFYCAAGLNVRVDSIGAPVDSALVRINDQQMWVSQGDRIMNDKCTVSTLDAYAGGGKLTLNCPVRNGRIDLSLASGKANLSINKIAREYEIGSTLDAPYNNVYLGYVGQDYKGNSFAVLVKDNYSTSSIEFQDKNVYSVVESALKSEGREINDNKLQDRIKEKVRSEYKNKLTGKNIEKSIEIAIVTKGNPAFGVINLDEVLSPKDRIWDLTREDQKFAKEYYEWAIKYYGDLVSLYPNEKILIGSDEESYAARGLYESAVLSRRFGMNEKALEYYDKLIREYPSSALTNIVLQERDLFLRYGNSNSHAMININGEIFYLELLDFKRPSKEDANAVLLIDGKENILGMEEIKAIQNKSGTEINIQLKSIDDTSVTISYSRSGFDIRKVYTANTGTRSEKINLGQQIDLEGTRIKLLSVNLKKEAKIRIEPKTYGPRTESNFSFKIGIEKRAIKLSPQKTKEMMENLQKTMEQWSSINNKLGKVVSGLKGACFATSAVLTAKNLLSGFSGESMARKNLMTKPGGWNEFCGKLINTGEASKYTGSSYSDLTMQKCLLDHDDKINKDIAIYQKQIQNTNEIIQGVQKGLNVTRSDLLDINGQVDAKKVDDQFAKQFEAFCRSKNGQISLYDKNNQSVSIGVGGVCDWKSLTMEQRKDIITLYSAKIAAAQQGGSGVLQDMIERDLGRVTNDAKNYWEYTGALKKQEEEAKKYNLGMRATRLDGDKIILGEIKTITQGDITLGNAFKNYNKGDNVIIIFIPFKESFVGKEFKANDEVAGKEVLVQLIRKEGGEYIPDNNGRVTIIDGTSTSEEGAKSVMEYLGFKQATRFRESNARAYQNKMVDLNNIYVKYFEQTPYKGMPAEVPFDVDNGWYVELTYVLSGFGKPYDESGRAVNFYICNVGPNGLIEFKKSADDICRYYNGNSDAVLDFPGMSLGESKNLLMQAQQAIAEAAKQYGRKNVIIGRNNFKSGISFGGEEGRCSDFMSPSDCNIMFNVCDPIMCPSSRCDLGGDFRVDNVVQTGVIGSLMLCLPNAKEGILMPVCLSGVHAGIEGYLSIMNSTVQCLNESLVTGKNIGICDEIKSIYLCEFFWKQATPLLNVIIPRLVESMYSQGVRGGGEYATVQTAWQNMQASINYFKNDYAVNSMIAFQARSTEEIGGEVCKSFTSLNVPNGRNFFDRLLEPDSPVQYTSWFSEDSFTTATLPPTSHYKVYYHIYAGKDQGAYYVIYLKDLPESNYIYSSQVYIVDRGYITRGSQIDQARDFTAVSGYKQLCVNINGKDECGFGKVTSLYAINSLSDAYAAQQVQQNIKSESNCVAGTPSMISVINPNLQAGIEDVVEPQLYNSGIIRVCATNNPGKKVLPNGQYDTTNSTLDRWKDVGYCDDPTIRCWIDTSSVKDVIRDKEILNETLKNIDLNVLGEVDYWTEEQSVIIVNQAKKTIDSLIITKGMSKIQIENIISSIVKQLTDLTNLGFSNKFRAYGMYLLGNLYRKVAENIIEDSSIGGEASVNPVTTTSPAYPVVEPVSLTTPNTGSVWIDEMLRKDVVIKLIKYSQEISYTYRSSRNQWVTTDKNFKLNQGYVDGVRSIVLMLGVRDKIYVEGEYIVKKTGESDEEIANKVFEVLKILVH